MNKLLGIFVASALLMCSITVHAVVIQTGSLSYDTNTKVITGDNGKTYLGWGQIAYMNYAQTVVATDAGGSYESYHIASQTEAYEFYNLTDPVTTAIDVVGAQVLDSVISNGQNRFGNNFDRYNSYSFFLSDETEVVGWIQSYYQYIKLNDSRSSIAFSDNYSSTGASFLFTASWLLVSDATIPEPSTIALMGLGLLGFGVSCRKNKHTFF